MSKPRTFQELATKVHVEVMIASHRGNSYSIESKKDNVEFKKNGKSSKNETKGAMSTFTISQFRLRESIM